MVRGVKGSGKFANMCHFRVRKTNKFCALTFPDFSISDFHSSNPTKMCRHQCIFQFSISSNIIRKIGNIWNNARANYIISSVTPFRKGLKKIITSFKAFKLLICIMHNMHQYNMQYHTRHYSFDLWKLVGTDRQTDRQTDRRTLSCIELLSQLKNRKLVGSRNPYRVREIVFIILYRWD